MATPEQLERLTRVVRRRRAVICSDLGLPPDADDALIQAKSAALPETPESLIAAAVDRAIDDLDAQADARLGQILARAVRRAPREIRAQVFELLGLGDLD